MAGLHPPGILPLPHAGRGNGLNRSPGAPDTKDSLLPLDGRQHARLLPCCGKVANPLRHTGALCLSALPRRINIFAKNSPFLLWNGEFFAILLYRN